MQYELVSEFVNLLDPQFFSSHTIIGNLTRGISPVSLFQLSEDDLVWEALLCQKANPLHEGNNSLHQKKTLIGF